MTEYDVIIVGAGPAGCSCALKLVESGLKIALIDKATFPRDKICGDALSIDVINQLPKLSESILHDFLLQEGKITSPGIRFVSPDHSILDVKFYIPETDKSPGYIMKRYDFDSFLMNAVKSNPKIEVIENCIVKEAIDNVNLVLLDTDKGVLTSKIVVGADGAQSAIGKQLNKNKLEKNHYGAGLRAYYENVAGFHGENFIELHFYKNILPGYFWIFPLPGNQANVGIGMLSSEISKRKINLKETLKEIIEANPVIASRFKNSVLKDSVQGYGLPLGSKKRKISGNRYLLVGDAASLIDPFTGEGIGNAIRSGRIAADHIKACFRKNDFTSSFNIQYDKEIYKKMWPELKRSRFLQLMLRYPFVFNFIVRKANGNTSFKMILQSILGIVIPVVK